MGKVRQQLSLAYSACWTLKNFTLNGLTDIRVVMVDKDLKEQDVASYNQK